MTYTISFTPRAQEDIVFHRHSGDKALLKKLLRLLEEIAEHPRTGTGQVERLKHCLYAETWSRRLNDKHRLIYEIHEQTVKVNVVAARGHYGDK